MEKKNSTSPFIDDVKQALQFALTLNDLKETAAINQLQYTKQILKSLKEMPKLKPPTPPLRLSEIAPTVKPPPPEEEAKPSYFERIRKLGRRMLRRPRGEENE